jgi:hypothetical protein
MLKRYKLTLVLIPWILLLVTLLLWSLGVNLPTFNEDWQEVRNTTVIIERIEELGKLELVKYNFKEIYDYQALSDGKLKTSTTLRVYDYSPDLKVALIASGEAVGCIDLRSLDMETIKISRDTLYFRIPEPELCYYKLDMGKTRIYDFERSGFWSHIFSDDDEVTRIIENAYKDAEEQIKISAIESGILDQTTINAEKVLKPILEKISGKQVVFTHYPEEVKLEPIR